MARDDDLMRSRIARTRCLFGIWILAAATPIATAQESDAPELSAMKAASEKESIDPVDAEPVLRVGTKASPPLP